MTLGDVYNEALIRLGHQRDSYNIDWGSIVKFVNNAVREVVAKTLPYKDYAYISTMQATDRTLLPPEYLSFVRLLSSTTGLPPFIEARYVAPKEYFSLSNWMQTQIWNQGSPNRPIFTIFGGIRNVLTLTPQLWLYMFPNTNEHNPASTAPQGYTYTTSNVQGWLEFYRMPDEVVLDADVIRVPYEFEDLVVLSTLSRIFAKTQRTDMLMDNQKKVIEESQRIGQLFMAKQKTEKRQLDNFAEPVVPFVDVPPQEGELSKSLTGK
jgi:hypothetical protein